MARGTQFGQLIEQFRNEARQSNQLSVGADSEAHVKQLLARTQRLLYERHFWPFLRVVSTIPLAAGQRYYNVPAGMNIDRVEHVVVVQDSQPVTIERGIDFGEYAQYDSDNDERAAPVERWDLRWTGAATQIEAWPIPDNNSDKLMFKGMRPLRPLIALTDVADLDDDLIVLFAAAEELAAQKAKDADRKAQLAQAHLVSLLANAQSGSSTVQMGLGSSRGRIGRTTVRVS